MARLPIPPAGTRSPPVCSIRAIRVVAIANPLRGLKSDTDDVTAVLKSVGGPIVLVGHSYAGSVIRNAATLVDNVVPLVFVAASAPDAGESAGQLAGRFPGSTLGDKLNMVDLPNGDVDLYVRQDTFWRQFCAARPESQANVMAVNQRPSTTGCINDPAGDPGGSRSRPGSSTPNSTRTFPPLCMLSRHIVRVRKRQWRCREPRTWLC
jgi:pimeloyl-ACP methyl ester carboxylesterase